MNKVRTILIAALMTVTTMSVAMAAVGTKSAISVREGKKAGTYNLIYATAVAPVVTIHIYDAAHTMLHSQKVKNEQGFLLPLDLSKLPYGHYTLEVIDGSSRYEQELNYQPVPTAEFVSIKSMADQKIALSLGAVKSGTTVSIFDEQNNLLHRDKLRDAGQFARLYNLQQVFGQTVRVEVREQDRLIKAQNIQL